MYGMYSHRNILTGVDRFIRTIEFSAQSWLAGETNQVLMSSEQSNIVAIVINNIPV